MPASSRPVWRHIGASPAPAATESVPIVIVGGGPVGLTLALDLGRKGHRVIVLNKLDFIAGGSRAICFSKRTLDIWTRLGVGDRMIEAGVIWERGKVFWGNSPDPIYEFDLLPIKEQKSPAFINLQQYKVEEILVEELASLPQVELRWEHRVAAIASNDGHVRLDVETQDGAYRIDTAWLIACDGSRSPVRHMLGLEFQGREFSDSFLIADIRMRGERPSERWFWFDPPFNRGRSALLHKQPDNVWRLDFQLGPHAEVGLDCSTEVIEQYVRGMLGDVEFEEEWYSIYQFQCRRLARFVHGRVIFAGDSAHLVSPFGARGCNGGVADADNLGWKLDFVLRGVASRKLLESYNEEAIVAADENILNSSRSTEFMTASSPAALAFREATLELASQHEFARAFVNSGRLSTAPHFPASRLNTPDEDCWSGGVSPGSPALDAPLGTGFLLQDLGDDFALLTLGPSPQVPAGVRVVDLKPMASQAELAIQRYDLERGGAYLIRPDHYVAGRWRVPTAAGIAKAVSNATGTRL